MDLVVIAIEVSEFFVTLFINGIVWISLIFNRLPQLAASKAVSTVGSRLFNVWIRKEEEKRTFFGRTRQLLVVKLRCDVLLHQFLTERCHNLIRNFWLEPYKNLSVIVETECHLNIAHLVKLK